MQLRVATRRAATLTGAVGAIVLMSMTAHAEIKSETVHYEGGDAKLQGVIFYDDALVGRRPAVVVVHEWWGLNDYARNRAHKLAELGYVAMALDMYGEGKTAKHPDDAAKFSSATWSNAEHATARFDAAIGLLRGHDRVAKDKIAAIGYCFGGGIVLNMARQGRKLAAWASFHGSLGAKVPIAEGGIHGRVFVATGGADSFVPPEQVADFVKEFQSAGADLTIQVYPGVKHSFTNPGATKVGEEFGLPLAYDADADRRSWAALEGLLKAVF